MPNGSPTRTVLVEETDSAGYVKSKRLEFYFNGIIGHLHDRWGYALNTYELCSQLANYWRSWFGAPTTGPVFESYDEPPVWENSEQSQHVDSEVPAPTDPNQTLPVQILQLACFLNGVMNENPIENAQLIREIEQTPPGQFRDFSRNPVDHNALANLATQLAILAHMLAQRHAAGQEIAETPVEDDNI